MSRLKTGSASLAIPVSSDKAQEAPLRVTAMVIDMHHRLCLISCDTLVLPADVLEYSFRGITEKTGIPSEYILLCATHNHHAPSTIDIFGFSFDTVFCDNLKKTIVEAAVTAVANLENSSDDKACTKLFFAEMQEATVGMNSRYLLKDGSAAWYSYSWNDVVRPTGPYDPDLPVFAFRRASGELAGLIFNHSVHNIGSLKPDVISPAFYGLTAQTLERKYGATTLFLPGAFGSTHNTSAFAGDGVFPSLGVSAGECVTRVTAAVEDGLKAGQEITVDEITALKKTFTYIVRSFDETTEEKIVREWTLKYTPSSAENLQHEFRTMRKTLAPLQGQTRQTCLQTIRFGKDIAIVGIPGELFARLGLEIRRRSPFRWTYIVGLANDTIGYIGDRESHKIGGYQLWPGMHSPSAPGTGEAMVEQVLSMLSELKK